MKLWMRLLAAALLIALLIPASALADGNTFTTADKEYMNLSEEGTVIQGDGFSIELNYCGPEGKRVFGRTYFPADFDGSSYGPMKLGDIEATSGKIAPPAANAQLNVAASSGNV